MGKLQNLEVLLNPQRKNGNSKPLVPEEKCSCYQGFVNVIFNATRI